MKLKSVVILGLFLFALWGFSAVYADTFVVGNSSFSLPDGYMLQESGDHVILSNDEYVMTMYEGQIIDTNMARTNRINSGYTLMGEQNYTFGKAKINQQNYMKDGIISCVYTVKKYGQSYIITLNLYDNQTVPEYEDNPVTMIIDTLEPNK